MSERVAAYLRRWVDTCSPLKALLHRRPHSFGEEILMVARINGVDVSERRVRICAACGATDAMARSGHRCRGGAP